MAVINPETDPVEIYNFFKTLNPPSVDFYIEMGTFSATFWQVEHSFNRVRQMDDQFTQCDLNDTTPIKIRILDDMIKALLGEQSPKEGLGVTDYGIVVIDTDGSIARNDTLKAPIMALTVSNTTGIYKQILYQRYYSHAISANITTSKTYVDTVFAMS